MKFKIQKICLILNLSNLFCLKKLLQQLKTIFNTSPLHQLLQFKRIAPLGGQPQDCFEDRQIFHCARGITIGVLPGQTNPSLCTMVIGIYSHQNSLLHKIGSDHNLGLLTCGDCQLKLSYLKLGCVLAEKLKLLKTKLKEWSKNSRGNQKQSKDILNQVSKFEAIQDQRALY